MPAVPEDTPDLPAALGLPAAELGSPRPIPLAAQRTSNRHVAIRGPVDALGIPNCRTFSAIHITDVKAAACVPRDDMPTTIGSQKVAWPLLCAAMGDWMGRLVAGRAEILHVERTSCMETARGVLHTAYDQDVSTSEVG